VNFNPKLLVKVFKVTQYRYFVYYSGNMKRLGEFGMLEDGFLYFWQDRNDGAWSGHVLVAIGNWLHDLNAAWDKQMREALTL